ncbi:PREDICTED: LOW QUALITY PROTEIN: uncharacterized protein LOC104827512 [Tarenaya hassleriana]|uniref:LOW QUALITY PROTEIN: uncharacterized protein LOC104827512 n=1 Tax=Tarenaya hassleriana TaxID=28532 RepID=UPI00053C3C4C|nr:PREDICTED: LOW QUALITY PROTEIN: uncharacterized protein LOC104827512 [Tarenaya hassleriana]
MDDEEPSRSGQEGSSVSLFDYSYENHLKEINWIADLCDETGTDFDENEINRLSSSITFLREWRYFNYEPRTIRFYGGKDIPEPKDISLPQFSSATVQKGNIHGESPSCESSKDFVMYVGGSLWALDWCPRAHRNPDARAKCEFLAVAAHPPESYTHKIGAQLTGRGIIQIWCILNLSCEKDIVSIPEQNQKGKSKPGKSTAGKPRGRPRKESLDESVETVKAKRPRGRPRKHPVETPEPRKRRGRPRKQAIGDIICTPHGDDQHIQALAVQYPGLSVTPLAIEPPLKCAQEISVPKNKVESEDSRNVASSGNSNTKLPVRRKRSKTAVTEEGFRPVQSDISEEAIHHTTEEELMVVGSVQDRNSLDISKDLLFLPRVVLCLAHNGKVAWDMKWRPLSAYDSQNKHIMGYLAVLLGNGALEVWEVPMPQAMTTIYLSSSKPETDPRFVKLSPVFRCSKLKCGDTQSIPLTVEWSTSGNSNLLLAGCHDGSVAIWKFSTTKSSEETRPLLFFSADTSPIRSVSWAPAESDEESSNVIVTAGHGGVKFWDIRDPFRPLWDLHPVPRFIYSLNWVSDPRCVLLSFDDGTIRIISLVKAAYDVAATGKPFPGTKQQGLSVYNCSSSPIWNVQVSPLTGIAAYCSADGAVLHFQLTGKAVEKDSRHRAPHFLCGFSTMENSVFTVHTPLPDKPVTLKKTVKESGENPKCLRSLLSESSKRASSSLQDIQPLALEFPEDPNSETDPEGTPSTSSHRNSKASKHKNTAKDEDENNKQALVCVDEARENEVGKEEKRRENEAEGFPPRMVAMHRVRWNTNKGSERWLCYGGAAGIVRCQEIALPFRTKR